MGMLAKRKLPRLSDRQQVDYENAALARDLRRLYAAPKDASGLLSASPFGSPLEPIFCASAALLGGYAAAQRGVKDTLIHRVIPAH